MTFPFTASDIIATLAFLLSAYATLKTIQFNNKQKALIESQEKLNQRLLEKEEADSVSNKKADLGASFIKLGNSKHRLKIWNKGKTAAKNVSIEFPEGNECIIESEITDKFPLEVLDTHQSVELIASVGFGIKSKHTIKLCWADEFSQNNEKIVYPTL
ncbi:hypothetical protein [Candidatus Thiothrix anitrata]|uniref:Uncharacterized protein n=1 Tax=Candidatus Thiothrix anitrata TaxID=2823902 RepID=A0ABX7X039_9GAMM|nr:hypothetical protein [Candidatus Thiothrix anitrata]QTR48961.1 hypothetical protein J8380_11810 [Candidatus Thiothrix anitrata]